MPTPRPLPWILGAVVAGAVLWLVFGQRDADPAAPTPHAQPPAAPPSSPVHPEATHHDPPAPGVDPAAVPADPATDDLVDSELMSLLPAPPDEGDVAERPARQPLTPEEQRQRIERVLALIDRSIERLEAERQAAEASGDARTAERNRIRVERLRQRRTALSQPTPGVTP
jgi:hypothetical protein